MAKLQSHVVRISQRNLERVRRLSEPGERFNDTLARLLFCYLAPTAPALKLYAEKQEEQPAKKRNASVDINEP
jgi:hypothetical protein